MSVLHEDEAAEPLSGDAVVARLDVILEELAAVVGDGTSVSDAERIDRITRLEKLRAVTAALQAAESVKFARVQRGRTERKHRRVSIRPAPDTMAVLTGYLPVEQGIACYATLRKHADSALAGGDGRTRDQIMADTLVERITGQTRATDVNIELQLMMPLEALLDPHSNKPATIPGYGPLIRTTVACRPRPQHHDHQQRSPVVASPVHRTQQRPYHRRRPGTRYLPWAPGQADSAP